ncbi:probable ribosomal protein S13 [Rhynchosporium secalis]|uniref:Probable ribosomal protein S13 n=1 Tax=Rhynchosporium secalis TaxID=38038 RepID=A0A1E1MR39_RHYSE|nr:probable ribosomal protein S13 [Rhynchosporium secalis]
MGQVTCWWAVFLLGIPFAETKLLKACLERFYGIGAQHSSRMLAKHSIFPAARIGDLPTKTILALDADLSAMKIENELRHEMRANILRLRTMGSYRGVRHAMGYPVRGQRTRSQIMNSRKLNRTTRIG